MIKRVCCGQFLLVMLMVIFAGPALARYVSDWTPIYEGVWYAQGSDTTPRPMRTYALRIDTANPHVSMYASHSNGSKPYETTLETTPAFRSSHGLELAVNANFFEWHTPEANNLGLLISNGTVVSPGQTGYGEQLRFTEDMVATLAMTSSTPTGIYTAVSGNTRILFNGSNVGDANSAIHPRTVMGLDRTRRFVIIVVIDGRQPGYSEGTTDYESAEWLIDFGAYNGSNFDGGGSSCICTKADGVLNSPSDGSPRAVSANLGAHTSSYDPRMDCWIIASSDGTVKKKTWTDSESWDSDWGSYGAPACGVDPNNGVTAVSRGPRLIDLFVLGNNGYLYRKAFNGSSWSGWTSVKSLPSGVTCNSGIDVCSWGIDRMDVVLVDNNGDLRRLAWNDGSWNASWDNQGGGLDPDKKPTIVSWSRDRLDVFAADDDGEGIRHLRYNGSDWLSWITHEGNPAYGLDAVSSSYGTIHVFYTVSQGNIYRRTYDDDGTWSASTNLGGDFNSAPGAVSYEQGHLMVFCRNASDGKCYKRNYTNGSWGSWSSQLHGDGFLGPAPDGSSWSNDAGTHFP